MTHTNQYRDSGNTSPVARYYPAMLDYHIGKWRRRQGKYDKATLTLLQRAWRKQPSLKNLLAYLGFRRDLGFLPSPAQLQELAGHLQNLPRHARHVMANLLCECGREASVRESFGTDSLREIAKHSPAVAELARQDGLELDHTAAALASLHAGQAQTRRLFAEFLDRHRGSICVAGNAARSGRCRVGREDRCT